MLSPELNDLDISKLFHWGDSFVIQDKTHKDLLIAFIRLVGDAELNRARVFALRKSAELRRKLKDLTTDERLAFIPERDSFTKDSLLDSIVVYKIGDITRDAMKEVKIKMPKEPASDASLEDQEKYQAAIDEFPKKREEEVKKYVEKKMESEKKKLESKSEDELYKEYETVLIKQYCDNEMIMKFREICAYFGSYKDDKYKERIFSNFEEFENLPKDIKDQFIENYMSLEINTDDLKN
jgi:hypothetical protein